MRVAVSGTHFSGKSALITSLSKQLPDYTLVNEPYFLLEEEGYEFAEPPSLDDFEQQFSRSIIEIKGSDKNTIFDRCPLDCLAYALAIAESSSFEEVDVEAWIQNIEEVIGRLDLIIFLPIEHRDRILVPESQDLNLRANVDEKLQEMLLDDSLGILENVEVLEVTGSLEKRVRTVKAALQTQES